MWAKPKNILLYILCILIGALIGFVVFDRILMPVIIGSGKAYPIPNLVGLTADDAHKQADSEKFDFKIIREEFSTTVPEKRVLTQIPKSGSLAKKGRTIRVVISKGGIKTIVPDIIDKLLRQAKIAIEDAGLQVNDIEEIFCDTIVIGRIISIEPAVGETLAAGTGVKLLVSKGAETGIVEVPNLVGMQAHEACKTLNEIGLKCIEVKRRIPTITDGEVFKQDPMPGVKLYRGNAIRIMVNWLD